MAFAAHDAHVVKDVLVIAELRVEPVEVVEVGLYFIGGGPSIDDDEVGNGATDGNLGKRRTGLWAVPSDYDAVEERVLVHVLIAMRVDQ